MGSDVVFDSLYLDRWLRSGWHLDIAMLLLLGVASLMCRTDLVVFGLPRSRLWRWLIWCHLIFDLSYLWYHTGGISHFIWRFMDPHRFCTIRYHLLDAHWDVDMIVTLRSPEIHPTSSTLLDAWMPSCLPIWEVILDISARFIYGFGWPVLHVRR